MIDVSEEVPLSNDEDFVDEFEAEPDDFDIELTEEDEVEDELGSKS